jgi:hypothetical protein
MTEVEIEEEPWITVQFVPLTTDLEFWIHDKNIWDSSPIVGALVQHKFDFEGRPCESRIVYAYSSAVHSSQIIETMDYFGETDGVAMAISSKQPNLKVLRMFNETRKKMDNE